MDDNNVIVAIIGDYYKTETAPSFLIDHGMQLQIVGIELPQFFEAHFSNSVKVDAKRQIGENNVVTIPDEYFLAGASQIYVWIYLHPTQDSGVTEYEIVIPLRQRPGVDSSEPTPEQVDIVDQAIAALNVAMEQTGQDVIAAQAAQAAAELAQGKAEDAQEKAEAAQGKAEAAQEAADDAQEAAETAEEHAQGYAEAASGSATAAAQSESNAEAWATGQRGGADVPSTDPTYENNAKFYAGLAEQSAGQAGYMFFYIDQNGHLIYQHTPNVLVDFYLFNGHLYVRS